MINTLIIGGGASGALCAVRLAEAGISAAVAECGATLCKKLLATGNGRCNLSNEDVSVKYYNDARVAPLIKKYGYREIERVFNNLGILLETEDGRAYPINRQAKAVAETITGALERLKVPVYLGFTAESIELLADGTYLVRTERGELSAQNLFIATGSPAGFGRDSLDMLKSVGVKAIPFSPALVWLECDSRYTKNLEGVRCKCSIELNVNGKKVYKESGELQYRKGAVSGIAVFNASCYYPVGAAVELIIDYLPAVEEKRVREWLGDSGAGDLRVKLYGLVNTRLADYMVKTLKITQTERAVNFLKSNKIKISGLGAMEHAQCAKGGVPLDEINTDTMEHKSLKGMYFGGEVLAVNGLCGGYNLHWAWVSAIAAAESIKRRYND